MKKVYWATKVLLFLTLIAMSPLPTQAVFSAVTNTNHVKIYAEPDNSAAVLAVLRIGDVVKVYTKSADGQYWEVDHKGTHGWIQFKYLSPRDSRAEKKYW